MGVQIFDADDVVNGIEGPVAVVSDQIFVQGRVDGVVDDLSITKMSVHCHETPIYTREEE